MAQQYLCITLLYLRRVTMLPGLTSLFANLGLAAQVSALGSSCSGALGVGTAGVLDPLWLEDITHQGTSAFNPDPSSCAVFRNVKIDYGAKDDGVTDDTATIK